MADERRKYIRLSTKHIGRISPYSISNIDQSSQIETIVKNVSAGGALFESKKKYSLGDLICIEIDLPGWEKFKSGFYKPGQLSKGDPVVAIANVVRVEVVKLGKLFDIGICFVGVDDDHQRAIKKYVRKKGESNV